MIYLLDMVVVHRYVKLSEDKFYCDLNWKLEMIPINTIGITSETIDTVHGIHPVYPVN